MVVTIEDAMDLDFNLIIEDFSFFKMISEPMKAELINTVFEEFLFKFGNFFS